MKKEIKEYKSVYSNRFSKGFFEEKVDVKEIIGELIDSKWSGSDKEQMKAVQLLKGLATSDDEKANKFMKAVDKAMSSMKKSDFE